MANLQTTNLQTTDSETSNLQTASKPNWVPEYIRELVNEYLLDGEKVIDVEKYDNGYGQEYLAVYTDFNARLLFDLYTHTFLRSEEA